MSFRLRTDAEKWFSEIADHPGTLKFDLYYFCLMAGFAGIPAMVLLPATNDPVAMVNVCGVLPSSLAREPV